MIKRFFLILVLVLFLNQVVFAKDIPIKVETLSKISTSNVNLQEGDNINFVTAEDIYLNSKLYIKKGTPVVGVITSLVNNNFTCQEASIYAENFKTKNIEGKIIKLSGIIHKDGRNHSFLTQYIFDNPDLHNSFFFIRGGEVKILPKKDSFTLFLEENKDCQAKREAKDDL